MILYNTNLSISIMEKKFCNQNIYYKFFVRDFIKDSDNPKTLISIIDNSYTYYTINFNKKYFKYGKIKKKRNIRFGFSICLNEYRYKKKHIEFQLIHFSYNTVTINYIDLLFQKLRSLRSKKKYLIVVRPKKGGTFCLFNSIAAFFPRRHYQHSLNTYKKLKATNNLNLINPLPTRYLLLYYKIKFRIKKRFYNFKLKKRYRKKKPYLFRSSIKIVFLTYLKPEKQLFLSKPLHAKSFKKIIDPREYKKNFGFPKQKKNNNMPNNKL